MRLNDIIYIVARNIAVARPSWSYNASLQLDT